MMTGIIRAFGLDLQRITSQGVVSLVALLIGFPVVVMVLGGVSGGADYVSGAAVGGAVGGVSAMLALLPLNTFTFEQQGQNSWMNGVIPVRRIHQVIGRYLVVAACMLTLALEVVLCAGVSMWLGSGALLLPELAVSVLAAVVAYALLESVMLPLCYRFSFQKALLLMMLICVGFGVVIVAVFALVANLAPAVIDGLLAWAASFAEPLSGMSVIWLSLVGMVLMVAAVAVSFTVSLRIYCAKEF